MSPNSSQIQISASSRGIADHFFCSVCDEYVWDCDHLIEERLREFPHLKEASFNHSHTMENHRRPLQ